MPLSLVVMNLVISKLLPSSFQHQYSPVRELKTFQKEKQVDTLGRKENKIRITAAVEETVAVCVFSEHEFHEFSRI